MQLLSEALWIERTLAFEVLPELRRESDSELLEAPLAKHLEETQVHAGRVEAVFLEAGAEPAAAASAALAGLRSHHDLHVNGVVEPRLRDLFLIDCGVRTEVLEGALYESLVALAPTVGADAAGLESNRAEEETALRSLGEARRLLLEQLPGSS